MSFENFPFTQRDSIILRSLAISPTLVPSTWSHPSPHPSPQPAWVHARVLPPVGFPISAQLDLLDSDTVSYATLATAFSLHANAQQHTYQRVERLAEDLAGIAIWEIGCHQIDLAIELPNAVLLGSSASLVISRHRSNYLTPHQLHINQSSATIPPLCDQLTSTLARQDRLILKNLQLSCIIGVLDQERLEEQTVVLNIICWPTRFAGTRYDHQTLNHQSDMAIGIRTLTVAAVGHVKQSSFLTVEALASSLADKLLSLPNSSHSPVGDHSDRAIQQVTVRIEKPSAIAFAKGAGVQVTRSTSSRHGGTHKILPFPSPSLLNPSTLTRSFSSTTLAADQADPTRHLVYLGLGSNMGDRLQHISTALDSLLQPLELGGADAQILDTSFMYESEPMYVKSQSRFLNAACKISTPLKAFELLRVLKSIEKQHGRDLEHKQPNGPRPLDLDILLFDSEIIESDLLSIPHIGMPDRQFVLEPLNDIAAHVIHPHHHVTIASMLARLTATTPSSVRRIHPVNSHRLPDCPDLELSSRTHLMSILNCTPDSFSDGGSSFSTSDAVRNGLEHVRQGADILDVGGMSTRPGADEVSIEEEIRRTVPVIKALRQVPKLNCHISIDTFKSAVAEAAVEAGATIVNDVSGGRADGEMLATVARLGVPLVLMHMRGDSKTMASMLHYGEDVVAGVRVELARRISEALQAGIKRWNLILDPGLGFAKDLEGNCDLIDRLSDLVVGETRGFPILVGPSRKGFIGELMVRGPDGSKAIDTQPPPPRERVMGTAAACTMAVMGGARVIRVHDTAEMRDVIRVVDGIRRARTQACLD